MDQAKLTRRPSRGAGLLILGIIGGILGAPFLAAQLLPAPEAGRIGVFERVVQTAPGSALRGSHFAPVGWLWGGDPGSGTYLSADRASTAHITMHPDVDDPDALLREGLPLGAALSRSTAVPVRTGLTGAAVEYDLAAGDNLALSATICTTIAPTVCVLVRANLSPGMEAQRDSAQQDMLRLIKGIEIAP